MYGYSEVFDLSPEHILQKVTQEQIFSIVLGEIYIDSKHYRNPTRADNVGKCWLEYYDGVLLFKDFADPIKRSRTCFSLIMDKYNLSFRGALQFICDYFGLSHSSMDYEEVKIDSTSDFIEKRSPLNITFIPREFNYYDKKYWSQYLIYPEQLIEDGVFPVERFYFNNKAVTPFSITYAYTFPEGKIKLYSPLASSEYKWRTNCDNNVVGNIDNIDERSDLLIIAKSYKDSRVLRNVGIKNVIWFQNEGQVPNDMININLISRFGKIIFLYDNDETGILASRKLSNIYNTYRDDCASCCWIPTEYKYKDPSDFIKKEGRAELKKLLEKMNLYGKNA